MGNEGDHMSDTTTHAIASAPARGVGDIEEEQNEMTITRRAQLVTVIAMAFALGGCATMRRHEAREAGNLLAAAGFTPKPANTSERAQQLQAMPPLKLVSESKDGKLVYRYADPYNCNCLYVGDEHAYAEYKRLALQKQLADSVHSNAG